MTRKNVAYSMSFLQILAYHAYSKQGFLDKNIIDALG